LKWYENYKEKWQYAATTQNFKKGTITEVKKLQFQMLYLIKEGKQKHMNYLDNVQGPFLKIERQMVEDHKHEYPEYIALKKLAEVYEEYSNENTAQRKAIKSRFYDLWGS